ncbi:MAG: peptidoglycan DD-metalloendopeptidase family protein [Pseudomonadota bacterium]
MIWRGLLLLLASVALAACNQGPPPVPYTTSAFDTSVPATPGAAAEPAVPLPQQKPGTTITVVPSPPVPAYKPGSEPSTVVVIAEPEPAPPVEVIAEPEPQTVFVDEELVLAPPAAPEGQDVKVQAGDTVYALSRRYGIAVRDIIQANNLVPPYHLLIGQTVRLPAQRTHVVRGGESIYGISRLYGITTSELVRANGLNQPYQLFVGQRLVLPAGDGSVPAPTTPATPATPTTPSIEPAETTVVVEAPTPEPPPSPAPYTVAGVPLPQVKPTAPAVTSPAVTAAPVNVADIPARTGGKFSWPVRGPVLSSFGPKDNGLHNDGINISAPAGSPVFAAEDGVVAYVGDELDGYGNLVLLRHGDGWVTAYAHNADVRVARGQRVIRGQVIASVGTTGGVGGPQTHFEIRKGSEAVDPMLYLEPL